MSCKHYFFAILFLLILNPDKGLTQSVIGQKVSDLQFNTIVNYKLSAASHSDFAGKLLILDFWHLNCAVCIQQFPKVASLQKKFGDRILILPVGFQEQSANNTIQQFIEKRRNTANPVTIPTAIVEYNSSIENSYLYKLFPFQSMPHLVWIDGDGVLRALTDHTALTENNILRILNSKEASLPTRKRLHTLLYTEPFLIKRNKNNSDSITVFGSAFSTFNDTLNYIPRLRDNLTPNKFSSVWVVRNINQPVLYSYRLAYGDKMPELLGDNFNKRVIFDSDKAEKKKYNDWTDITNMDNWQFNDFAKKNLFSYELILPKMYSREKVLDFVIQDFDRYFQVKSLIENRNITCLALKRVDFTKKLSSKMEVTVWSKSEDGNTVDIQNGPIKFLIQEINSALKSWIVVDETGISENIDIILSGIKENDLFSYRAALKPYGLDLIQVERNLPMLVIKEKY